MKEKILAVCIALILAFGFIKVFELLRYLIRRRSGR